MFLLAFAAAAGAAGPHVMDVRLVAETVAPTPGRTALVGFEMNPKPGWHGYWSNPGGSGLAPKVRWSAPPGVHFGPLLHPAPTFMRSMGLVSFVHAGKHVLLSRMSVDKSVALGTALPVTAELDWAACSDNMCVPQHATLSISMTAGDGAPSADAPTLRKALRGLPGTIAPGTYSIKGRMLTLQLPAQASLKPGSTQFYPNANGYFDPEAARAVAGSPLQIESHLTGEAPKLITGVVSDGASAYRVDFFRGTITSPADPAPSHPNSSTTPAQAVRPAPRQTATPAQPPSDPAKSRQSWIVPSLAVLLALAAGVIALALRSRRY